MISLNGRICTASAFDWLGDSGFRYGFGCFETMYYNGRIRFFNDHIARLNASLNTLGMTCPYDPPPIHTFITDLATAIGGEPRPQVCRLYVTGGAMGLTPGTTATATVIIAFAPLPDSPIHKGVHTMLVTPHDFYRFKYMAYAHHIQALQSAPTWPIYVDDTHRIIDSPLFSIGVIQNDRMVFATHPYQLPSVSKTALLTHLDSEWVCQQPLYADALTQATTIVGCNALKGVVVLDGQPLSKPISTAVGALFNAMNGSQ